MADGHTCTTATDPDNFKGGGWVETRNLTSNFLWVLHNRDQKRKNDYSGGFSKGQK